MTDEDVFTIETWFFAGNRVGTPKPMVIWVSAIDKEEHWFDFGPAHKDKSIGGAYEIETCRTKTNVRLRFGTAKYRGNPVTAGLITSETVAEWRTLSQAADVEIAAQKKHARMIKENSDIGNLTLRDLRSMIGRVHGTNRGALIATVLTYITRGNL